MNKEKRKKLFTILTVVIGIISILLLNYKAYLGFIGIIPLLTYYYGNKKSVLPILGVGIGLVAFMYAGYTNLYLSDIPEWLNEVNEVIETQPLEDAVLYCNNLENTGVIFCHKKIIENYPSNEYVSSGELCTSHPEKSVKLACFYNLIDRLGKGICDSVKDKGTCMNVSSMIETGFFS